MGPRRPGPRGHGALSRHGGLRDYTPGEPPGPRRRRWRPAFEEVGQTWVSPRPGGATLLPSVHFVVSLGAAPAGDPSSPRFPRLRGARLCPLRPHGDPSQAAPTPAAQQPATPPAATLFLPVPQNGSPARPPSLGTPPPPPPRLASLRETALRRTGVRARCPDVRLALGPWRWEHLPPGLSEPHLQAPGPSLRAPGSWRPIQPWPAMGIRAEDGPGLRAGLPGSWGLAGTGKRGGGEEGAGAIWAAGGIPGSAQTGPGAARCEMRLVERPGQRAGGGGRTASASRRPPAPVARRLCPPCLSERPRQALPSHLRWPSCLLADRPFVSFLIFPNISVSFLAPFPLSLTWCLYVFLAFSLGGGWKPGRVREWMRRGREDFASDSFLQRTAAVGGCGGSSHGPGISSRILLTLLQAISPSYTSLPHSISFVVFWGFQRARERKLPYLLSKQHVVPPPPPIHTHPHTHTPTMRFFSAQFMQNKKKQPLDG